jgi:two-component system cell cycle response regulator DivK
MRAVASSEARPDDVIAVGPLAGAGQRVVLLIEDDDDAANLVRLLLEVEGYTVLRTADAEAGLQMARSRLPDLIVMDIQLPGMDGLTAAALLKQDPATAAIPIIALTALAMREDRERGKAAGCDAYIAKPLRYRELFKAIDGLLNKGVPAPAATVNEIRPMS